MDFNYNGIEPDTAERSNAPEANHSGILQLLSHLRYKIVTSCLSHDAKMKAIQDLQNAELKVVADLNPVKEQVNNKRS